MTDNVVIPKRKAAEKKIDSISFDTMTALFNESRQLQVDQLDKEAIEASKKENSPRDLVRKMRVSNRFLDLQEKNNPELVSLIREQRKALRDHAENNLLLTEYKHLLTEANDKIAKLQSHFSRLGVLVEKQKKEIAPVGDIPAAHILDEHRCLSLVEELHAAVKKLKEYK